MSKKAERYVLAFIIVGYLILAWSYAQGPLFEPPDEDLHYDYIRVLAKDHILPDPYPEKWTEYLQPPGYYLLNAPILALLPDHDFESRYGVMRKNPYAGELIDIPHQQNRNQYLHDRSEKFPYTGNDTARNAQVLRWFSIFLCLLTLYFSYRIFQLLWPDAPYRRLLALAIIAFWPLYLRMAGAINNDNLVYLVATLTIYLLLRQVNDGPSLKMSAWLGVVLGVGLMTKSYTGFLAFPVGAWVTTDRHTWRYVPLILALTIVIGGWWYAHNIIVYGNPTFYDHPQLEDWAVKPNNGFDLDYALHTFPHIFDHFWAHYHLIVLHRPLYTGFYIVGILSIIGALAKTIQFGLEVHRKKWTPARWMQLKQGLIVGGFLLAWFLMIFYICGTIKVGYQGRYALGAMAGLGALMSLGLEGWLPAKAKRPMVLSSIAFLATLSSVIFTGYYRAAFTVFPAPDKIEHPIVYRYEDTVELIGVKDISVGGQPGDVVEIEAYWRALHPADSANLVVSVTAFGSTELRKHSYPGGGNLLATDWQAGAEWTEHYYMEIPKDVETQKVYPLSIGLFDLVTDYIPPVTDANGQEAFPVVGRFIVHGTPVAQPTYQYTLGHIIGLTPTSLKREGDDITLCVDWVSLKTTSTDFHYFVHVYQGADYFTQADSQPRNGDYPTGAWLPGEVINDCMTINTVGLAATDWSVKIGLYDPTSLQRLPIRDDADNLLANDWLSLGLSADGSITQQN
ncbi:MAG: glycosyltransferase family 39 protein [Chloroflexi bacterium]|nr:glycosyltransferase family 39 protein [Chloroflexota bacterium]